MCHIERHIQKSEDDLIKRLLTEWKEGCGVLFDESITLVHCFVNNIQPTFDGRKSFITKFDNDAGILVDRKYNVYSTKYVNIVVENCNGEVKLITAYPYLSNPKSFLHKYDISKIPSLFSKQFKSFDLFKELTEKDLICRLDPIKDSIHIFVDNYKIKCKNGTATIIHTEVLKTKTVCEITYQNTADILEIVKKINNYDNKYTIFGKYSLEDWITGKKQTFFAIPAV